MSRSLSASLVLLLALGATGCAQQGSTPQGPAPLGAMQRRGPADLIPYRFSGGSGTAHFTAKGKSDSCGGTLTFADNVIYVDVKANGDVDPGHLSEATLIGTSTCKGQPVEFAEAFELKSGSVKGKKINDVQGKPPSDAIFGSFTMTGTLCDATVHLERWIVDGGDGRVHIDAVHIAHLKETLHC